MNKQQMIWVALGISVILNAGAAGFVIARMTGGEARHVRTDRMAPETRAMAEVRMREMRAAMHERRKEMQAKTEEMRAAQRKASELLRQEELDEQRLRETFAEIRRLHSESELMMQEALLQTARQMDAREREKLARYVERRARLSRRDHRRTRPQDKPPASEAPSSEKQN